MRHPETEIRPRRTLLVLAVAGWLAVVGMTMGPGRPDASRPAGQPASTDTVTGPPEGEGALRVALIDERLEIRWGTGDSVAGHLEVRVDGQLVERTTTTPGFAHRAEMTAPTSDRFLLRYGSDTTTHETEIDLALLEPAAVEVDGTDSLYLVGDTHGEYERLRALLRNAGVVDEDGHWVAGSAHLALLGDLMDRGAEVTRLLWFAYRLEREARAAGGAVHVLLGNHELMVLTDDSSYVHADELRIAGAYGMSYADLFDPERTVLGRWLAAKPPVMKVGDVLLAHGGVSSDYLEYSLEAHRDSLHVFMGEKLFRNWSDTTVVVVADSSLLEAARELPEVSDAVVLDSAAYDRRVTYLFGDRSVFWHRGYVATDTLGGELARVLERLDAQVHAVGHTPTPLGVHQRYGGTLIVTDPPDPASQLVLLVRDGDDYDRYGIGLEGPPEPLPSAPDEADASRDGPSTLTPPG